MKKVKGKALSLVLSLALVITSFSAIPVSAATESATVTLSADTVYFANGGGAAANTDRADVINYLNSSGIDSIASASGNAVTSYSVKDVALTSGSSLATLAVSKDSNGDVTGAVVRLTDPSKTGTVGLSARYVGSYSKPDGTSVTVNAVSTFKIIVEKAGISVIGAADSTAPKTVDPGKNPAAIGTLAKSGTDVVYGAVYTLDTDSGSALAKWTASKTDVASTDIAAKGSAAVNDFYVTQSNSNVDIASAGASGAFSLTTKGTATELKSPSAITLTAVRVATAPTSSAAAVLSTSAIDKVAASTKIENRIKTVFGEIAGYNGHIYIAQSFADISGSDLTKKTLIDGVNVETSASTVNVNNGTVAKLTASGATVNVLTGSVAEIAGANIVTVTNGSVGAISGVANQGTVTVYGGKVGTITPASSASIAVTVDANADKIPATVSSVTASTVTVGSASTKTSSVVSSATSPSVEIYGSKASVGTVNANKDVTAIDYESDYVGSAVPVTNVVSDKLPAITVGSGAEVTYTNAVSTGSLTVDGKVTFAGDTQITGASGSGTIVFTPGKFYTTGALTNVVMEVLGGNITAGLTLFSAPSYTVYEGSFTPKGYTIAKVSGDKTDVFKVDAPQFYGIVFSKTSDKIVLNDTVTYTASAYPTGTKLPEGTTIKLTFDGAEDYFTFKDNGDGTATVKAIKYDTVFSDLNKGTITATLYDQYGVQLYEYSEPTLALTIIPTPETTYRSDTGTALNLNVGATYQFKITSLDGKDPIFAVGGNSLKVTSNGKSGSDYFYKVTAVGQVGDSIGVYINHEAKPSTVVTIVNPFKSDTTAVTKTAGQTYQFKITGPSQPKFQVADIGDIPLASKSGSDYFYKVTVPASLAKGAHGVYVNGVRMAIFTVA